ncbi:MAG: ComF family protein [Rikenellaceae bacterium]|nr:ComF family protein [Rikenellaceae bacterium]
MSLLKDIAALIIPPTCPVCGRLLFEGERMFCVDCMADMPLTHYSEQADNPMFRRFWGIVPIERATALIYFVKNSGWQRAIHNFKYEGAWRIALECGYMIGGELLDSNLFYDIDVIVPVPLHTSKLIRRGYNQSAYIAKGIAEVYEAKLSLNNLVRVRNNANQAQRTYLERWQNVSGIFKVRHPERFEGKHILLVDDVFTTGATLIACAEALLASCKNIRISVATLAIAQDNYPE